jgi:hypothetical protein
MRALVFDSKSESGATFEIGRRGGNAFDFSRCAVVWGDVCVDFYKYKNKSIDSQKKHLFFLTFHTAFYVGQRNLYFGKSKLDKLCKDQKNKLCDPDFGLSLSFDLPESSKIEQSHLQAPGLKNLMRRCGTAVTFAPGEIVLDENTSEVIQHSLIFLFIHPWLTCIFMWQQEVLFFIVRGTAEGIVEDVPAENGVIHDHPLGRCVPVTPKFDDVSLCQCSQSSPNLCMVGPESVLPSSSFLNCSALTMKYKARTEVEVIKIKKLTIERNKKTKWAVLQSVFSAAQTIGGANRRGSQAGRARYALSFEIIT